MQKYIISLLLCLIVACSASTTYIIKPAADATGVQAALIFVQGAQISNTAYETLMKQIQANSGMKLFIGLPGFMVLDTPSPIEISSSIKSTLDKLYAAGLAKDAPIFYSGHSLGSVMVQDYLQNNNINATGLILTGGYLQRKYYWPTFTFKIPTLIIGGELDGLSRITRIAESFYIHNTRDQIMKNFPVIVAPGVNHYQFAGTGQIPFLVKERDLQAESTQQAAWDYISYAYIDFIKQRLRISEGKSLALKIKQTEDLVNPIIQAYLLEGSKNFNSPIQIGGPLQNKCIKGGCSDLSPWVENVQEIIGANIDGWKVQVSNQYAELSATPLTGKEFHLPKITSFSQNKTIKVTTFAQNSYETLDSQDTAFVSTSAFDIAAKLASRQCLIINGTQVDKKTVPFTVDDPSFCRQANEQAYAFAQSIVNQQTLTRFQEFGVKYTFVDDVAQQGGPLFLYSHVKYSDGTDKDGNKIIVISSPEQKTEIDYWINAFHIPRPSSIPDPGCYHYCKVLSPARVIEWIYVDSLREKFSIKSQQKTEIKFLQN